jgi:CBS domain-containing protein
VRVRREIKHRVRRMPVLDAGGSIIGMMTDEDLARRRRAQQHWEQG